MRLLVGILGLSMWLLSPAAAGGMEDEARRQLGFARAELVEGRYDRALKSAESAIRLHPSLYEAMVVKALAYEGLGELTRAEVMLLAYVEFVGEERASDEARGALDRVRAAQEAARSGPGKRRGRRGGKPPDDAEGSSGDASSDDKDPEPYRQRVRAALREGRCAAAFAAAEELVEAAPEEALGWRLRGDAARCSNRTRSAVLSYERAQRLGDEDSALPELVG